MIIIINRLLQVITTNTWSNNAIKLSRYSLFQYILNVGHLSFGESRDSLVLPKCLPVHDRGVTWIHEGLACTCECLGSHLESHRGAEVLAVSRYLNTTHVASFIEFLKPKDK
jgi:hypothetical protein